MEAQKEDLQDNLKDMNGQEKEIHTKPLLTVSALMLYTKRVGMML